MPDSYEALHPCLNASVMDGAGNPDADAATNIDEFALATDPCLANVSGTAAGATARLDLSTLGAETTSYFGFGDSYGAALSDNGRHVALTSVASNLVSGDSNVSLDVFVRDRDTDADGILDEPGSMRTALVTRGIDGMNGFDVDISSSGRYVSFASNDNGLVPGDSNGATDAFIYDRDTDADGIFDEAGFTADDAHERQHRGGRGRWTHRADVPVGERMVRHVYDRFGESRGRRLANKLYDVYVRDRDTDADGIYDEPGFVSTARISTDGTGSDANGNSGASSISDNGRYVAFY